MSPASNTTTPPPFKPSRERIIIPMIVIGVSIDQSEARTTGTANPVLSVGEAVVEGAGRKLSWRISRQLAASREGQLPVWSPGLFSTAQCSVLNNHTSQLNMDMKKRITLELRNRSPAEVSDLDCNKVVIVVRDARPEPGPCFSPFSTYSLYWVRAG